MIFLILLIISSLVSLVSLFFSISNGYFDYYQYENKLYNEADEEIINIDKQKIIDKYYDKVLLKK